MSSADPIPWLYNTSICLSLETISSGRLGISSLLSYNLLGEGPFEKNLMSKEKLQLNKIEYAWPKKPTVVVCIDGGDPEYIDSGIEDGIIPNIEGFI